MYAELRVSIEALGTILARISKLMYMLRRTSRIDSGCTYNDVEVCKLNQLRRATILFS
jgi:hypothetical protein